MKPGKATHILAALNNMHTKSYGAGSIPVRTVAEGCPWITVKSTCISCFSPMGLINRDADRVGVHFWSPSEELAGGLQSTGSTIL